MSSEIAQSIKCFVNCFNVKNKQHPLTVLSNSEQIPLGFPTDLNKQENQLISNAPLSSFSHIYSFTFIGQGQVNTFE